MAPDRSAFPVGSVGPCLEATAGIPFTIRSVTSWLLPWRTFTMYIPLQDIIWLLRRLRLPQRPLAFSRLQAGLVSRCRENLVDFPSSEARDNRTFSCLLHAGWSWGQRGLGGGSLTPATLPFWSRCISHFHLLVLTTLTQISFVSMGPGLVGEPRCGSQCRTFVRRLHTPVLAKPRRMLRSPYVVVLAYLLMEQSLTSLNGAPPSEPCRRISRTRLSRWWFYLKED
jgi:hypothetical protein